MGLTDNIRELDAFGYTVVRPELVGPASFIARLVEASLTQAEKRLGVRPDIEKGFPEGSSGEEASMASPFGAGLPAVLLDDPAYQEAILNPAALAIADYLLGRACVLDMIEVFIKGASTPPLKVHVDQMSPSPFPPYAQFVNITWALTDYSLECGPTAFVPGTHKLCRHPMGHLGEGQESLVPVEAAAGSLVVWHGNTWHAALPRTSPGLRMSLLTGYRRSYLQTTEGYRGLVPDDVYAANPARFRQLIGAELGWARTPYTDDYDSTGFITAASLLY